MSHENLFGNISDTSKDQKFSDAVQQLARNKDFTSGKNTEGRYYLPDSGTEAPESDRVIVRLYDQAAEALSQYREEARLPRLSYNESTDFIHGTITQIKEALERIEKDKGSNTARFDPTTGLSILNAEVRAVGDRGMTTQQAL